MPELFLHQPERFCRLIKGGGVGMAGIMQAVPGAVFLPPFVDPGGIIFRAPFSPPPRCNPVPCGGKFQPTASGSGSVNQIPRQGGGLSGIQVEVAVEGGMVAVPDVSVHLQIR